MDEKKKLYLAGPLGFSELGRFALYEKLIPMIENLGFEILDPWKLNNIEQIKTQLGLQDVPAGEESKSDWQMINPVIAENNFDAIRDCDLMVAILDGTDVDSGTAVEIGFAHALARIIIGYRGDFRQGGDNPGSRINLQAECCIVRYDDDKIQNSLEELEAELIRYLNGGYWADDESEEKEDDQA